MEFLAGQIDELYEEDEYRLIRNVLIELETYEEMYHLHQSSVIQSAVRSGFEQIDDPEDQAEFYYTLTHNPLSYDSHGRVNEYCDCISLSSEAGAIYNDNYSTSSRSSSNSSSNSGSSNTGTCARCHQRDATNGVYCYDCYCAVLIELADNGISENEIDMWANGYTDYED